MVDSTNGRTRKRVRIGLTLAPDVADILEENATEERPRYKIIEEAVRVWAGTSELIRSINNRPSPVLDDDLEAELAARQARAEKKAGRAKRKAELQESVKEALPVRAHSFHSGSSPIPGCADCAALVTK